jgi:hypothetical protein
MPTCTSGYALFQQPQLFQRYVVVSPDLPYGNGFALIHRAKHLEAQFGAPAAPGGLKQVTSGGKFSERPH